MTYFRTVISAFFLLPLMIFPSYAEQYEVKEYTVQPGDTLWGIMGVETQDSFQWPLLWKENPGLKDPDKIYPGQLLRIPTGIKPQAEAPIESVVQEKTAEAPKAEAPKAEEAPAPAPAPIQAKAIEAKKAVYVADRSALLFAGYITKDVPNRGKIIGSPSGASSFGTGDEVYLSTVSEAKRGQKFYVIRKATEVRHPKAKKKMGWLVEIVGTIQVEETTADGIRATIKEAFTGIALGDQLDDYYNVERPFVVGVPRKPELEGFVVATKNMRSLNSQFDVIHIDKGSADGIEPGDVFSILATGTKARQNATVQIIAAKEKTATAMVLNSMEEVRLGDSFVKAK